jgi:soluble lytic murein transglycosylase-like protein
MAAAAAAAGHPLAVTSGYRSDAEQAVLFAENPDPRWVAPPGRSLHRCATELDLGPPSAYGWLAANARRFGFVQRYEWENWHYGFVRGSEPCAATALNAARSRRRSGERAANALPAWVPSEHRAAILGSAAANGVSARLLAAQLSAESGFNPRAVSPAGAQGIAQFMPATARAVGLADPFDPDAAIAAQGRLMAKLIAQFGSPTLALAAYNAGPGAVAACSCVPPYPETRAYVAQISGLMAGAGADTGGWTPGASVRLVA